jgi:uncharacterized protein DUF2637
VQDGNGRPGRATRSRRWRAGVGMAYLAAAAAVISYLDGLYLVHLAGAIGLVAYLYPLLPDGLIVVSFESIHDARQSGHGRPGWATTGIILGAVLTLGMNVAAGAGLIVPMALVDGVVPVVFFVALEILIGLIRRGRGSLSPMVTGDAPATSIQPEPAEPPDMLTALRWLVEADSQRKLAAALGVPKSRIQAWAAMARAVDEDPPAGTASPAPAPVPAGAELQPSNGQAGHG